MQRGIPPPCPPPQAGEGSIAIPAANPISKRIRWPHGSRRGRFQTEPSSSPPAMGDVERLSPSLLSPTSGRGSTAVPAANLISKRIRCPHAPRRGITQGRIRIVAPSPARGPGREPPPVPPTGHLGGAFPLPAPPQEAGESFTLPGNRNPSSSGPATKAQERRGRTAAGTRGQTRAGASGLASTPHRAHPCAVRRLPHGVDDLGTAARDRRSLG